MTGRIEKSLGQGSFDLATATRMLLVGSKPYSPISGPV